MKVKSDHRSNFSNLSNWKEETWKNQVFNGIRTRDLRDTGAILVSQGKYASSKNIKFPRGNYPIVPRHKHSIVFIVLH